MTFYRINTAKEIKFNSDTYSLNEGDLLWITAAGSVTNDQHLDTIITPGAASGVITVKVDGFLYSRFGACLNDASLNTTNMQVTVGKDGAVISAEVSAMIFGDADYLDNAGLISGGFGGATIVAGPGFSLTNAGRITNAFDNCVQMESGEVRNSGSIEGLVAVTDGDASLINSGYCEGFSASSYAALSNTGDLGPVTIGYGFVQNLGNLFGGLNIESLAGQETRLANSGEIVGVGPVINGGEGNERIANTGAIMGEFIFLAGGADRFDTRHGVITAAVFGEAGADTLLGGAGDEDLRGGVGADRIVAGAGDDAVDGGTENDVLNGGAGDDVVLGVNGSDKLTGGLGDDALNGGDNADTLAGGRGDDTLTGGSGVDRFEFSGDFGHDLIADFAFDSRNGDRIVFSGDVFADFDDLSAHMTQVGSKVLIETDDGHTILLRGVSLEDLDATDFVFG